MIWAVWLDTEGDWHVVGCNCEEACRTWCVEEGGDWEKAPFHYHVVEPTDEQALSTVKAHHERTQLLEGALA